MPTARRFRRFPRARRRPRLVAMALGIATVAMGSTWSVGAGPATAATTSTTASTSSTGGTSTSTTTPSAARSAMQPPAPQWQAAWTSPMDLATGSTVNATARDTATVAIAGTAVELRLSNQWSTTPTTFGAVTVGLQQAGVAVVPNTTVPVTFGGSRSVTIPAGQDVTSDAVPFTVQAGQSLAVSLWVTGAATVSVHFCCNGRIDSYATPNNGGNLTLDDAGTGYTVGPSFTTRWLSAISVTGTPAQGTVVAFGDSITDGYQDAGAGWPAPLQQRIDRLPASEQMSVVNEGISGNTLTSFPAPQDTYVDRSGGQPGVVRLNADALSIPGARTVVLFLGTNDIWFGSVLPAGSGAGSAPGSATSIIAAMQSIIAQVHAAGMRILGVTLLPRATVPADPPDPSEVWTAAEQSTLDQVNAFIRSSTSGFDGVLDFAAVAADVYDGQCNPSILYPPYNSGDNLHPSVAGEVAMANAVPTTLFEMPEAPQIANPVTATPTPGCAGAVAATQALSLAQTISTPPTTTPPTTTPVTPVTTAPPAVRPRSSSSGRSGVLAIGAAVLAAVLVLLGFWRRQVVRRRRRLRKMAAGRPRDSGPAPGDPTLATEPIRRAQSIGSPDG